MHSGIESKLKRPHRQYLRNQFTLIIISTEVATAIQVVEITLVYQFKSRYSILINKIMRNEAKSNAVDLPFVLH